MLMTRALVVLLCTFFAPALQAQTAAPEKVEKSRCHVFVDYENVWTLEINVDGRQPVPILNIITFSEDELPLRPAQIHIANARGKQARVEKFSIETGVEGEPYVTDFLQVVESSFLGMDLVGDFADFAEPTQVSVDLGDTEFQLQAIDCLDYETLAQKIDQINFNSPNIKEDFEVLKVPLIGARGAVKKGRR